MNPINQSWIKHNIIVSLGAYVEYALSSKERNILYSMYMDRSSGRIECNICSM